MLKAHGWQLARASGSHHIFKKDGRIVVVAHPKKDIPKGILASISRQAGITIK
jgi:predicted RNA binding protein YcfA (HicA-like mRNA interferase family)